AAPRDARGGQGDMSTGGLRIVVIDDEPLARMRIKTLLAQAAVPNQVTAEHGEPVSALLWLKEQDAAGRGPDMMLLDIQMPGLDGMVLAARLRDLRQPPVVVFLTAHAEHALRAFDLAAADYLTKPVRLERLNAMLERVERLVQTRQGPTQPPSVGDGEGLVVQDRGRLERIPLSAILYFKAEQKYVTLRTADASHVLDESLTELESKVGERFIRVHRNALVSRQAMKALERRADDPDGGETWAVQVLPT